MRRVWRAAPRHAEPDADDQRLVDGLRRGAPEAFADLHDRYATSIYNLALRMLRQPPDAEDVTQDVLLRAYQRLPRARDVALRPWLYRLTVNCCYDHMRASARRRPPGVVPEREVASPHDLFEQSDLSRLFDTALQSLTARQRAALLLKDVHGLSLREVASTLDLTPGSVEVLLARARKAFRAAFAELCRAEGRSVPACSGLLVSAALPLLPLPAALQAAPAGVLPAALSPAARPVLNPAVATPAAPAAAAPVLPALPPLAASAGGFGALFAAPAAVKTAAAILAATAAVTAASAISSPRLSGGHPAGGSTPVAALPAHAATAHPLPVSTPAGTQPASPGASASASASASPSASPVADTPETLAQASPTASASPGDPSITMSPKATESPTSLPTPVSTPTADPSPAPTPDATPSSSGSPSSSGTPSPTPST